MFQTFATACLLLTFIVTHGSVASAKDLLQPWTEPAGELIEQTPELQLPSSLLAEHGWLPEELDPQVMATQLTTPRAPSATSGRFTRSRQTGRSPFTSAALRTGQAAGVGGLASVPFMIGDTGAGTCLAFATIGYFEGALSHPTLTCSRLNIAENNRAVASDRAYISYRHFHNSTPIRAFQHTQNLDVDRATLGLEKTFCDGMCSVEVRVPFEFRLTSTPQTIFLDNDVDGFLDPGSQLVGSRDLELANISTIFKVMLAEHDGFLLSAGLGVTAPTARDVNYQVFAQNLPVFYPGLIPPLATLNLFSLETHFKNESWYLSPFLAWASKREDSRFFHQGFLQVEMAANPTPVRFTDFGSITVVTDDLVTFVPTFAATWTTNGNFNGPPINLKLHAQPLMRINIGGGYNVIEESDGNAYFEQLSAMLELHYTTTLQNAKLSRVPLDFSGFDPTGAFQGAFDAFDPALGNIDNRVDILNLTTGFSAKINGTVFTNGFTVPLRTGSNRGFDFEYNLQVQRPF